MVTELSYLTATQSIRWEGAPVDDMGVSGVPFWAPCNKGPTVLGPHLVPLIFGNWHITPARLYTWYTTTFSRYLEHKAM